MRSKMAVDDNGDYRAWAPSIGDHTLKAIPYTAASGGGTEGTALEMKISVTETSNEITNQ